MSRSDAAARVRAAKAQAKLHEGPDSEEEDAGADPSLKGVLQHMIAQGVSQDGDRYSQFQQTFASVRSSADTAGAVRQAVLRPL